MSSRDPAATTPRRARASASCGTAGRRLPRARRRRRRGDPGCRSRTRSGPPNSCWATTRTTRRRLPLDAAHGGRRDHPPRHHGRRARRVDRRACGDGRHIERAAGRSRRDVGSRARPRSARCGPRRAHLGALVAPRRRLGGHVAVALPAGGGGDHRCRWASAGSCSPPSRHRCWPTGSSSRRTTRSGSPTGENALELDVFLSVAGDRVVVRVASRRVVRSRRSGRRREALDAGRAHGVGAARPARRGGRAAATGVPTRRVSRCCAPGDDPMQVARLGGRCADRAPPTADDVHPLASGFVVVHPRRALGADDHRVLRAFLAQLSRALEQQRLREIAAEAEALARADELRTAMLRAVSHDLRSPLASIKASVSSMRQPDVEWPAEARDEFLASIEDETDRLTVDRDQPARPQPTQAGVLRPVLRSDVDRGGRAGRAPRDRRRGATVSDRPATRPPRGADRPRPARSSDGQPRRQRAALVAARSTGCECRPIARGGDVQVHVIDHGPGIPLAQRAVVVQPFHRLDDSGASGGLGLGLAIADRFVGGDGRHARTARHARRRSHRRGGCPGRRSTDGPTKGGAREPHPVRRGRAAPAANAGGQPAGTRLRGRPRPDGRAGARAGGGRPGPTWWSSTSACPASRAWR